MSTFLDTVSVLALFLGTGLSAFLVSSSAENKLKKEMNLLDKRVRDTQTKGILSGYSLIARTAGMGASLVFGFGLFLLVQSLEALNLEGGLYALLTLALAHLGQRVFFHMEAKSKLLLEDETNPQ